MNKTFINLFVLTFLSLIFSVNLYSSETDSLNFSYKYLDRKPVNIANIIDNYKGTVLLFFSPECPICQSQTKTINELFVQYEKDSIAFMLIFPGNYYSKKTIKRFINEYGISIPSLIDKDFQLTRKVNATVTPEAILIDNKGNRIYSGLIDNYFEDIGKRRSIITEHYLQDAIDAILQNIQPKTIRTQPVGCILNLEYNGK